MTGLAASLLPLLDLTRLQDNDAESSIAALCQKAVTPYGKVAAVCVYPHFVATAQKHLANSGIKIATVSNFPQGNLPLAEVLIEIKQAIAEGADEIDVVMPYQAYLAGEVNYVKDFIRQCRAACGKNIGLKVILETGALQEPTLIAAASRDALDAGADFIKTSTGKIALGATPEAVKTMLSVIRDTPYQAGCKISGGVRTLSQAAMYWQMAQDVLGPHWASVSTFRIGASQLLDEIIGYLQK